MDLGLVMNTSRYGVNTCIIKEGDTVDHVNYLTIIRRGEAVVTKRVNKNDELVLAKLGPKAFVTPRVVLQDTIVSHVSYPVTVKCTSMVEVVHLSKHDIMHRGERAVPAIGGSLGAVLYPSGSL